MDTACVDLDEGHKRTLAYTTNAKDQHISTKEAGRVRHRASQKVKHQAQQE